MNVEDGLEIVTSVSDKEMETIDATVGENDTIEENSNGPLQENVHSSNGDDNAMESEEVTKIKNEHFQSNQDEFSSENFKVELSNLPKHYPLSQLKKLLNTTLQLDPHRVKPAGMGRNAAYVNFKNEKARDKALNFLEGYKWLGSAITAKEAEACKDPVLLAKIDFLKVSNKDHESLPVADRIQKAVTSYHDMPYEEQLKQKQLNVRSVLRKFGKEMVVNNPEVKKLVHWQKMRRKGQVCELDEIVESPVKTAYRNKCEFTIGKSMDSEKVVVGFRVASYKEGSVEVGPVEHLTHINEKMKLVVKLMETFLESSPYEPYDPFTHKGAWRQLAVRTSNNNDVMLIVQIHPQKMSEDELKELKEDFKNFFTIGGGIEAGVTSIFFHECGQLEKGADVQYEHLFGKTYIEETILGKTFKASPHAFLQVNTAACEKLYEKIAEVADIDATTVVLDVCCGVGTIGLTFAEMAYKVMGVELTPEAVDYARLNAEASEIGNAVFYNGKAEDYMETMLDKSKRNNCIAIIDPPRAGVNSIVMNSLRKCDYLDKVIYIACDAQAAMQNFLSLCRARSKTYKGNFYVPLRAVPVDLFPDTPHYELIMVFERYDECKWERIMAGNPRPKDQAYFDRVPEMTYDPEKDPKMSGKRRKKDEYDDQDEEEGGRGRGRRRIRGPGGKGRDRNSRRRRDRDFDRRPGRNQDFGGGDRWGRGYWAGSNYDVGGSNWNREQPSGGGVGFGFNQGYQEGYESAMKTLVSQVLQENSGSLAGNLNQMGPGNHGSGLLKTPQGFGGGSNQYADDSMVSYPTANPYRPQNFQQQQGSWKQNQNQRGQYFGGGGGGSGFNY